MQPPGQHQAAGLGEVHPDRHHAALLVLAVVPLRLGHLVQPAGEVAPERLGAAAGRVVEVDQDVPLVGGEVGLLGELPAYGDQRVLAGGTR